MARIRRPQTFTRAYGISDAQFNATGAFNPVLNVDTRLFLDPQLLVHSAVKETRHGAKTLAKHYGDLFRLLRASKSESDVSWRAARQAMQYREVGATCLGYGAATVRGSGFGSTLSGRLLKKAKEIIDAGLNDPELFLLLPLLEEGVGPDRLSDMTTNIILSDLVGFTQRVCAKFSVPLSRFIVAGREFDLPRNPSVKSLPVLLVPRDVLAVLPVASDWESVCHVAARNAALRRRVNDKIGRLWRGKSRDQRDENRAKASKNTEALSTLLDVVRSAPRRPYAFETDPDGLLVIQALLGRVAEAHPKTIGPAHPTTIDELWSVVVQIVEQFRHLVEDRNFAKMLWRDKRKPHGEKTAQMLFFVVADSYCSANDVDITPEADTGVGPVDFKLSRGHRHRALVEIKLSRSSKLVAGYMKQLGAYEKAEGSLRSMYLVST